MALYKTVLQRVHDSWLRNESSQKLTRTTLCIAMRCSEIKKIVCIGLGGLEKEYGSLQSNLQYVAVFTIVNTLNHVYQYSDQRHPPVRIIVKDPCIEEKDRVLLRSLAHETIEFVDDPDGMLHIEANTLVITANLLLDMPLIQIIADLFHADPDQGPAAIICDKMELDIAKQDYCLSDRESPTVARFLTTNYVDCKGVFSDHELEQPLFEDVYGVDWADPMTAYWQPKMSLYIREGYAPRGFMERVPELALSGHQAAEHDES